MATIWSQVDIFGHPSGLCVFCHDDIPTVLNNAHHFHKSERLKDPRRPGIHRVSTLCWSCHHGLLHAGIISVKDVQEAEAATRAGTRKVTHDEVYRQIAAELASGKRKIDHRQLHNLTDAQLAERAMRAWKARRAKAEASLQRMFT